MKEDIYRKAFGECDFEHKRHQKLETLDSSRENVAEIYRAYKELAEEERKIFHGHERFADERYAAAFNMVRGLSFNKKDISAFCSVLMCDAWESVYVAGTYLSALVNMAMKEGEEIEISLYSEMANLGHRHPRGTLIVHGNTEFCTGRMMSGGKIIIKGNAGNYLGEDMKGGEIVVMKNAGHFTGFRMEKGLIDVKGRINSIDDVIYGGEIRQKGKRVWPR